MSQIEKVFDVYVDTLVKEGGRFAKIKALSLSLEVMNGGQRIARALLAAFIATMLLTGSFFSCIVYCTKNGAFVLDAFTSTCLVVFLVSASVIALSLREKTWLRAFGILERMNALEEEK